MKNPKVGDIFLNTNVPINNIIKLALFKRAIKSIF